MRTIRRQTLRSYAIVAVLLLSSLPAANFAAQLLGIDAPSLLGVIPPAHAAGGLPVLGIDCGVGTFEGTVNPSAPPAVIGDGATIDTSCTWSGDADALSTPDETLEPLVSDAPESTPFTTGSPGGGGVPEGNGGDAVDVDMLRALLELGEGHQAVADVLVAGVIDFKKDGAIALDNEGFSY